MEQNTSLVHGNRVTHTEYGEGTVEILSGDRMDDGTGRNYNWPGYVCVRFDKPLQNGEGVFCWCTFAEVGKL